MTVRSEAKKRGRSRGDGFTVFQRTAANDPADEPVDGRPFFPEIDRPQRAADGL